MLIKKRPYDEVSSDNEISHGHFRSPPRPPPHTLIVQLTRITYFAEQKRKAEKMYKRTEKHVNTEMSQSSPKSAFETYSTSKYLYQSWLTCCNVSFAVNCITFRFPSRAWCARVLESWRHEEKLWWETHAEKERRILSTLNKSVEHVFIAAQRLTPPATVFG